MKRLLLYIASVLLLSTSAVAQKVVNIFEVADTIEKPVVVETNQGTYTIYGGERIPGHVYRCVAEDAYGNKIVERHPYRVERDFQNNYVVYWQLCRIQKMQGRKSANSNLKEYPEKPSSE